MTFRILGLDPAQFQAFHALATADLAERGMERVGVAALHSAPCRVSLDDVAPGGSVLLLNHTHQPADTPYHQQGPIFVSDVSVRADYRDEMPPALARRTLSLRGFDAQHMMIEADLVEGAEAPALIARFFANPGVAYIHAHYARRGCFAATIERA
jgi:hypothetical protein